MSWFRIAEMIQMGYMAKRVPVPPEWIGAPYLVDVCSVSNCVNDDFGDYISHWKHNGFWFFNSPGDIQALAQTCGIDLKKTRLFYYEAHPREWDGVSWKPFEPEEEPRVDVVRPSASECIGFDVVTFSHRTNAECSPLSCNGIAGEIPTNIHCLFDTLVEAIGRLEEGAFANGEPGPYRIFAVYSVEWVFDREREG